MALIEEVEPLRGARDLLGDLKDRGHAVGWTSSADVDATKLTGGFSEAELREAGAGTVFQSIPDLREHLHETPFG